MTKAACHKQEDRRGEGYLKTLAVALVHCCRLLHKGYVRDLRRLVTDIPDFKENWSLLVWKVQGDLYLGNDIAIASTAMHSRSAAVIRLVKTSRFYAV